ncbi:hypothetical protein BROUX41_002050 [Berkeleyomyces rouxiae]|uniref:uncharacterized protein n=1 Tax=Berkeleyomyces rouxiae TaxID=2035830 RepID=UPI003B822349
MPLLLSAVRATGRTLSRDYWMPRSTAVLRALPPAPTLRHAMRYSTEKPAPSHTDFYKTFGRPIAKVLLVAMFTYQLLYLGWTKLEHDDIKSTRNGEVAKLEEQVKELANKKL